MVVTLNCENPKYLFPEAALAKTFRRLYWHGNGSNKNADSENPIPVKFTGLRDLLLKQALILPSQHQDYFKPEKVRSLENQLYKKRWVVYAKQAFGGPDKVIKYLGCYTHRVAISNRRILAHRNGLVSFSYKDRKNENAIRTMQLPDKEFALRFLQHVIPSRFMKIRSYGFLANRKKQACVKHLHDLLGSPETHDGEQAQVAAPEVDQVEKDGETLVRVCPKCGKQTLVRSHPLSDFTMRLGWKAIWDNPYRDTS